MAESRGEVHLPDKLYFRIGEVSELVGVEPHVLRYWETEFRMRPHRSSSGQRLYRKKDIGRFLRIKKLLHTEGFTIAGARKILSSGDKAVSTKAGAASAIGIDMDKLSEASDCLRRLRQSIAALRAECEIDIV
jgi:DNA-binding transcriptional MerR regulator